MIDPTLSGRGTWGLDSGAVLDALPRAVIVTAGDGRILYWNRRAVEVYGWQPDEVLGRSVFDVLVAVPDRERGDQILGRVRAGQVWEGDFTVLRRDGSPVRVWVSDRPVMDGAGNVVAVVGASEDVTEQRLLEQKAADLTEHLRLALDAGHLGTFRWHMATGTTEWDTRLEALFGLQPGGFGGTFDDWVDLMHPDDAGGVLQALQEAVRTKSRYSVEHRVMWPDGTIHWLQGAGQVTLDRAGEVTGTIGCTRDVTGQKEAEEQLRRLTSEAVEAAEAERISRERLQFLSRINDGLSSARNRVEIMTNVAQAAVPWLGDWCAIFVLPRPDATVPDIEIAHVDPSMLAWAKELQDKFPYDPDATEGMPKVIRTGQAEFYPDIDEAVLEGLDTSEAGRDIVRRLALRSAISVPLIKKGTILGGMQLIMSDPGRRYTLDDLTLARAVAARVASSLENQRLTEDQRSIATTLQASLLPDRLPTIPSVDLAVRYWATGAGIEVGGDFYDVFPTVPGTWAVVIGDVCGTGPTAAAVTGMARHTIASAAWHNDDHVSVLANLNSAMLQRNTKPFCTAIYGTLQPSPVGVVFTFASGGHPLPIVARSDGTATTVGASGTMIGVFDHIDTTVTTTVLNPGDTVVLYTDGATDVPRPHDLSTDQVIELVGVAARDSRSAEALADRLHDELSAILPIGERSDDIALLILRVSPPPEVETTEAG